jgi:hypothetical protein
MKTQNNLSYRGFAGYAESAAVATRPIAAWVPQIAPAGRHLT